LANSDYALSSELNLRFLQRQLKYRRYIPTHASKVYTPKPSGILRPISLLTVNDQITYQAIINVVAEALYGRTRKRYRKEIFHHLYAGKSSQFFYLKWQDSYRSYSNRVRSSFRDGYVFVATFDLTAFYDSIDHYVIRTFLRKLRFDQDAIDFLLECLRAWTSTTWSHGSAPIYHQHGIPQGPISSGMLSEVILQHIDTAASRASKEARYLRYVDDIKIMAKSEESLRRRLVTLDLASKEVGLFPQTAKIAIRKIVDPEDEIKSVSRPPERALRSSQNQEWIRWRVRELANRGKPTEVTRFKYVLSALTPTAKTNYLLFRVLTLNPHLVENIARHWSQYTRLPPTLAKWLLELVKSNEIYHHLNAQLLDLMFSRVRPAASQNVATFAYERLFATKYRKTSIARPQPTYKAALVRWALLSGRMDFADYAGFLRNETDWWVRQSVVRYLEVDRYGPASFAALLNRSMREDDPELARASAAILFQNGASLHHPYNDCNLAARLLLKSVKIIPRAGRHPSLIDGILAYVLKRNKSNYDWQRFFGSEHRNAEQIAIIAKQRFETDIDAFVVVFDSFCDNVLRKLYEHQGSHMKTVYGSALAAGAPRWLRQMPALQNGFAALHRLRVRSFTAHPWDQKTGAFNKRIKHAQYFTVRKHLVAAYAELEKSIKP
jgi:Reverse transcriptase (RNA-dependent DNA polymerase)